MRGPMLLRFAASLAQTCDEAMARAMAGMLQEGKAWTSCGSKAAPFTIKLTSSMEAKVRQSSTIASPSLALCLFQSSKTLASMAQVGREGWAKAIAPSHASAASARESPAPPIAPAHPPASGPPPPLICVRCSTSRTTCC